MIIKPCYWCIFEKDCVKRRMVERKIKQVNHGVLVFTKLSIRCQMYYGQFEPGERVNFYYYFLQNEESISEWCEESQLGTVMGWKGRKVKVWLDEKVDLATHPDDDSRDREIVCIHPKNHIGKQGLNKLNEERVPVCIRCGKPEGKENKSTYCDEKPKLKETCYFGYNLVCKYTPEEEIDTEFIKPEFDPW